MTTQNYDMTGYRCKIAPDTIVETDARVDSSAGVAGNLRWDIKVTKLSGPVIETSYALIDDGTYPGQTTTTPPPAPPELAATAGDTTVALSIVNPVAGMQYTFYRWQTAVIHGPSTDTTFTDTGRTNGTSYTYFAKATNAGGTSDFSAGVSVTPQSSTPPPPPPGTAAFKVGFFDSVADVNTESGSTPAGLGVGPVAVRVYRNYPSYVDGGTGAYAGPGNWGMFHDNSSEKAAFDTGHPITISLSRSTDKVYGYSGTQYVNAATTTGVTGQTIKKELQDAATRMYNLQYGVSGRPTKIRFVYEHEMDVDGAFKTNPQLWRNAYKNIINIFWGVADSLGKSRNLIQFGICPTHAPWAGGNILNWWGTTAGDTMDGFIQFLATDLYNDCGIFGASNGSRTIEWASWASFQTKYQNGGTNSLPNFAAAKSLPVSVLEVNCVNVEGPYDPNQEHPPTGTQPASDATKQWWINMGNFIAASAPEIDSIHVFNQGQLWDASYANHPLSHAGLVTLAATLT